MVSKGATLQMKNINLNNQHTKENRSKEHSKNLLEYSNKSGAAKWKRFSLTRIVFV